MLLLIPIHTQKMLAKVICMVLIPYIFIVYVWYEYHTYPYIKRETINTFLLINLLLLILIYGVFDFTNNFCFY
jgi:hypothetical protein